MPFKSLVNQLFTQYKKLALKEIIMSVDYSVFCNLNLKYNDDNIKKILSKGEKLGMQYYTSTFGCIPAENDIQLYTNTAIEEFKKDPPIIRVVYQETLLSFGIFKNSDNRISIMFPSLGCGWSKIFQDGTEDLDMDRYSRLMLDLIDDYQIESFVVEKS